MDLISLIIIIVLIACVCYGISWAVRTFNMPHPVLWVAGAIVLIILLMFLLRITGFAPAINLHTQVLH